MVGLQLLALGPYLARFGALAQLPQHLTQVGGNFRVGTAVPGLLQRASGRLQAPSRYNATHAVGDKRVTGCQLPQRLGNQVMRLAQALVRCSQGIASALKA